MIKMHSFSEFIFLHSEYLFHDKQKTQTLTFKLILFCFPTLEHFITLFARFSSFEIETSKGVLLFE